MKLYDDALIHEKNFQIYPDTKIIFFDLETTGLNPQIDHIIEFGAYATNIHANEMFSFQTFVNIHKHVPPFITKLTRIDDNLIRTGMETKQLLEQLHQIIGKHDILVAHNGIHFDLQFLNHWCDYYHIAKFDNPFIDTLYLARFFLPELPNHKLGTVCKHFMINYDAFNVAHRADADAKYLCDVFWKLMQLHPDLWNYPLQEWNDLLYSLVNLDH